MDRHPLYQAALNADEAFSAELQSIYGRDACNARYDHRNSSTPRLIELRAAKHEADAAWLAEMRRAA